MSRYNLVAIIFVFKTTACFCQTGDKVLEYERVAHSKSIKAEEYYHAAHNDFDKEAYQSAIEKYKIAIALDSDYIDAFDNLGLAYRKMNKLDSAEYCYFASLRKYPQGYVPVMNLAIVEERRGNPQKAADYYKKLVTLRDDDPEGYYGLLRMYVTLKMYSEALDNGNTAEKYYKKNNSPYIGDCYYYLCFTHYNLNNIEMARKYMNLAQNAGVTVDKNMVEALK